MAVLGFDLSTQSAKVLVSVSCRLFRHFLLHRVILLLVLLRQFLFQVDGSLFQFLRLVTRLATADGLGDMDSFLARHCEFGETAVFVDNGRPVGFGRKVHGGGYNDNGAGDGR